MQNEKGFTLIELAIVLSLIMILTALAAPSLRSIAASSKLKSSASEIRSLLIYARDVSVTENTNYLVLFDLNNQRYWLASSDDFDLEDMSTSLAMNRESESETTTSTSSDEEETSFSRTDNLIGIPREVKTNITIAMISVSHGSQANPISTGIDYICFTPTGMAEAAEIYLQDSKGKNLSIIVDQATGHISIEKISQSEAEELGLTSVEED